MKTTKEVLLDLPAVHLFASEDEIYQLASSVNVFIHGKVHVKCEVIGQLGGQFVGLFYLQRDRDSQNLRDNFVQLIENEEAGLLPTES